MYFLLGRYISIQILGNRYFRNFLFSRMRFVTHHINERSHLQGLSEGTVNLYFIGPDFLISCIQIPDQLEGR
jgi:hypothetical protein